MNKRLIVVLLLGFSSGLPLSLISSTLQAWYADQGMSIMVTGILSLISFPYVYRFLWAPLLDRFSLFSLGKRRSWILSMQIGLFIGFNLMAWFSPTTSPVLLAGLALLMATLSATQDIAIDAHRTEYLHDNEYAIGASLATFGYRIALFVSGGLSLLLANYVGWHVTYRLMGLLMLFGVIGTLISPEPSLNLPAISFRDSIIGPCKDILSRNKIIPLLCFIFLFKAGEAFTTITSGIVMPFLIQGLGFSLLSIANISNIIGITSVIVGGLIAGVMLLRWSLFTALLVIGLLQSISNTLFIILAIIGKNMTVFIIAVICDNFAAGMGTTALVAFLMHIVNKNFTASQFSIFIAFSTLPRVLSGPFSALLQSQFGWVGLYEIAFLISLMFIPFLLRLQKESFFLLPNFVRSRELA